MQPMQGAQMEFKAGSLIFAEGDPGGDLYFLREGEVEVFREAHGQRVALATLVQGEILGIMTCLTREPRLAAARARTDVKALVVKQAGIKTLISTTPPWVSTVIKDFILRVKHMDECYARAVGQLASETLDLPMVRLGVMLARGLGEVGGLLAGAAPAAAAAEARVVDVDAALARLAGILVVPRATLDAVFDVFVKAGLLKADPGAGGRRAELGVLERLAIYADVCARLWEGGAGGARLGALTERDCAFLTHLGTALAKGGGKRPGEPLLLPTGKLVSADFPADYVAAAVQRAAAAGLVTLERGGAEATVSCVPTTLVASARSLDALRLLRTLDALRRDAGATRNGSRTIATTERF